MPQPAPDGFPLWIQYIFVAAGAFAVFCGTLIGYVKKGRHASASNDVAVVSAAFADKRTVERLIAAIEDLHDVERRREERSRDLTEALRENTDAMLNMLAFIQKRDSQTPLRGGDHLEASG